ncbi:DUF6293 family protein [Halorubrum lacusprofundi]|nr:DUF6293 family protein [Halorubrum lacusprofundi]
MSTKPPAIKREADIVILVSHNEADETAQKCRDRITSALDEQSIRIQEDIKCDIFDLNDSLETILTLIRNRNPDDTVRVNISAGSKITAIAGMLACMFTDADPYYVVPEGYNEDTEEEHKTVSHGMESIKSLPAYPVTEPDLQLIQVLAFIEEEQPDDSPYGVLLKDIGEYLLEQDLPAVHGSNKSPGEAEDIYPTVNQKVVNPLLKRQLISKTRLNGGTQIRTTQEGKEMLALAESLTGEQPSGTL